MSSQGFGKWLDDLERGKGVIGYRRRLRGCEDKRLTEVAEANLWVLRKQGLSEYVEKLGQEFRKEGFCIELKRKEAKKR